MKKETAVKEEGNETVTNCNGLKMQAADGKMRLTHFTSDGRDNHINLL